MVIFRKTYKIFSKALLLSVYTIFFCVQLFFNFETFSGTQVSLKYASLSNFFSGHQYVAVKGPLHAAPKATIRLNKRFQQENNNAPIDLVSTELPAQYALFVNKIPFGQYRGGPLPFVFLPNTPLRGPPPFA